MFHQQKPIIMKKIFLFFSMLLAMGLSSACSSDDDCSDTVQINFVLLNENKEPTQVFKYGEDICFELSIANNSDNLLYYGKDIIIDDDLFRVFSEDGIDVGTPWTNIGAEYVQVGINKKTTTSLTCSWMELFCNKPLLKSVMMPPLSKGTYYTRFKVRYRNLEIKTKESFLEKEFNSTFKIQ